MGDNGGKGHGKPWSQTTKDRVNSLKAPRGKGPRKGTVYCMHNGLPEWIREELNDGPKTKSYLVQNWNGSGGSSASIQNQLDHLLSRGTIDRIKISRMKEGLPPCYVYFVESDRGLVCPP